MKTHTFDTYHRGHPRIIASTGLETNEGLALFDVGPESTFSNLTRELRKAGFNPEDVRHVLLSHIHFDHAGAAWRFAELGATIYVHPRGAPHLVDPSKLVASATRIYGAEMERLWGRFDPVPTDRLRIVENCDTIRVAPFEIHAIETPGHASHHHVYHWEDSLFGGDIAGVRIGGGPPVPPLVPPELDIESWIESIGKIRALNAARVFLPHFGVVEGGVAQHMDLLADRIRRWSLWFRDQIRAGQTEQQMVPAFGKYVVGDLREAGASKGELNDYERADPSFMAVTAATRYWKKYHPEEIRTKEENPASD